MKNKIQNVLTILLVLTYIVSAIYLVKKNNYLETRNDKLEVENKSLNEAVDFLVEDLAFYKELESLRDDLGKYREAIKR